MTYSEHCKDCDINDVCELQNLDNVEKCDKIMEKQTIKKNIEIEIKILNGIYCDIDDCIFFDDEYLWCSLFEHQYSPVDDKIKRCQKCIDKFGLKND